jgi:hypothetical protein
MNKFTESRRQFLKTTGLAAGTILLSRKTGLAQAGMPAQSQARSGDVQRGPSLPGCERPQPVCCPAEFIASLSAFSDCLPQVQ